MRLNTACWRVFRIADLFEVSASKDANLFNSNNGRTPFVASSSANNGITGYVDAAPSQKANTMTIARNGSVCSAFYQPIDYCASPDDIRILTPKFALTPNVALFVSTVIQQEKYKYSYGRKLGTARIKELAIKLPADSMGLPDWGYMEQYIKTLPNKPITTKVKRQKLSPLVAAEWKEYLLGDLFTFHKGKRLRKQDMAEGQTNYLGAISDNNGVRQLIDIEPMYQPNCITINYNGSVGEAFYQPKPFWASDDVNILYANGWELDKYIAMFIITVIKANRYKFSYGRKWTLDKMKESMVKLPGSSCGSPDWAYMGSYIRSLPYSDRI